MSNTPLLEVQDITKKFGGLTALRDVSITFEKDRIYSLIGPNGAGKTTLFNCITGYHKPTNGMLRFNGQSITGLDPNEINRRGIARTFQIVNPFEGMTVRDNIKVGAYFGRASRDMNVSEITDQVLSVCKLKRISDQQASTLSIGDAKRLEVAKAYATDPDLLLADEPSAGLNPTESKTLIDILEKIRETGVTICLVEHDMDTVMTISEQIFVLDNGRLLSQGTPSEIGNDEQVIKAYLGTQNNVADENSQTMEDA